MINTEQLQIYPDFTGKFTRSVWRNAFSKKTLHRSKKYLAPPAYIFGEIANSQGVFEINAKFLGSYSETYHVNIVFDKTPSGEWFFEEECTCPVGYECKHSAAALQILETALSSADQKNSPHFDQSHFDHWLNQLQRSEKKSHTEAKKTTQSPTNFLAYCIQPSQALYDPTPKLSLHTARQLKNGELRIDHHKIATADPYRPPQYMHKDDIPICMIYHQLVRLQYTYGAIKLEGTQATSLLTQIIPTNRLYYISSDHPPLPIELKDPIHPQPIWEKSEDGSTFPSFAPPLHGQHLICPTEPSYVAIPHSDEARCSLHPLETSSYSTEFLTLWKEGPSIPAEKITQSAITLQKKSSLPTLKPTETISLDPTAPIPQLRLERVNLSVDDISENPISAALTFRYHSHSTKPITTAEPTQEDSSFFATKDNTIYEIPRNLTAELQYTEELTNQHKFVKASHILPNTPRSHQHHYLPNTPTEIRDQQTALFITQIAPILSEQGWEITIAESAKVEIHTIADSHLETGLTESPDHGIDWFEFSASYLTPTGDRQPLLPLLSNYIQTLDFEKIDTLIENTTPSDQTILADPENPNIYLSFPTLKLLTLAQSIHQLFGDKAPSEPLHTIQAATLADSLEMDGTKTIRDLKKLGNNLKNITSLPKPSLPKTFKANLRDYQMEGFHWMQFLARHSLHGILADDMGLGKTVQALAHIQAEVSNRYAKKKPTLVLAPTSVTNNWINEAKKFTPKLTTLLLHGPERKEKFPSIPDHGLIVTSYALFNRDHKELLEHDYHLCILDEAQYIKNPAAKISQHVCQIKANHRIALSGTPMENHLGELWSQMRFLMPGLLGSSDAFRKHFRTPIEKHQDTTAQLNLNSRIAPLILRRTKEAVATELPPKTEILHKIPLLPAQVDIYETVRAAMDSRIRDAIATKGLAKSQIIVLDALLKLRQICCHPQLLKLSAAQGIKESAKLNFLTKDLLPTLLSEGRRILIFSSFTTMLGLIEDHIRSQNIPFSKITGKTKNRQQEVDTFQHGETEIFLISLKAGGTGLNLTAADTVIHYDPWWNPAAENQATDRAYRIGQDKPVFVHKLITEGSIEERILELQQQKAQLVDALLSEKTNQLKIDQETLGNLLAPI